MKKPIWIFSPARNYPLHNIQKINSLSRQIPVISVGDKPPSCHFDSVELDSKKPGYMLGEYLLSLGHTRITYISTPIRSREIGRIHRLEGVRQSFRDHNLPVEYIDVRYPNQPSYDRYARENAEYQNGYDLAAQALAEHTPSTAFIGNHASAQKGREAVDMIYRKNQQKKNKTERNYIMHMEYEPQLIIRKSTGKARRHSL